MSRNHYFELKILPGCDLFTEARMRSHTETRAGWWAVRVPDDWASCPNCLTPWKCNGPHEPRARK